MKIDCWYLNVYHSHFFLFLLPFKNVYNWYSSVYRYFPFSQLNNTLCHIMQLIVLYPFYDRFINCGALCLRVERSSGGTHPGTSKVQAEGCSNWLQRVSNLFGRVSCRKWGNNLSRFMLVKVIKKEEVILTIIRTNRVPFCTGFLLITHGAGSWASLCSQFPCGMHWRMASVECEMP